jgi:hypothetical protein
MCIFHLQWKPGQYNIKKISTQMISQLVPWWILCDRISVIVHFKWCEYLDCFTYIWCNEKQKYNCHFSQMFTDTYTKHTYKTKDRVTRTPLKTGLYSSSPEVFFTLLKTYFIVRQLYRQWIRHNLYTYDVFSVTSKSLKR